MEPVRLVDLLRAVGPLLAVLAVVLLRARRRIVQPFQDAAAFTHAEAISLPESSGRMSAWWQARLSASGVLHATANNRHWFDRDAWERYRASRRRRALTATFVAVVAVVVAIYLDR